MAHINLDDLHKVGQVAVDSGQVCIVDPCYIKEWGEYEDGTIYKEACDATLSDQRVGPFMDNLAVASSTNWGDGVYNTYVKYDGSGRPTQLIIDFVGEIEGNECVECGAHKSDQSMDLCWDCEESYCPKCEEVNAFCSYPEKCDTYA